ncbi:MAG TPA: hypothetical protein VMF88_15420 [Bacteroidota bacterium]|nr:hypothetical protein [Bacteroidota bacterium]
MKYVLIILIALSFVSCNKSKDNSPVSENKTADNTALIDTTSLAGITLQVSNVDYTFSRVNQWSFGGFSESFKGFGPKIDTYNQTDWPSDFIHFYMQVYFRNANCSFPPDSFRYVDLSNKSSIDTSVVEVGLTPSNSMTSPWAVYSNVITTADRQLQWVPTTTGRIGINKHVPCPYTNPGHTVDMNVTLENIVLTLVDSSGDLSAYGFPKTVLLKHSFFKVIKY